MKQKLSRRTFGRNVVLGTAIAGFPFIAKTQSPNSKLQIASIGVNGRAAANLQGVAGEHIVALADVDASHLEAARQIYTDAKGYADFRVMLEKEGDRLDAVVVSTPDHTHAPAAAMVLRAGKHLYCEKPLTHTVHEARVLARLAREHRCVTQMGTQIHSGKNYRRVVELIQRGAIGDVREVHVWVNVDHSYSGGRFVPAEKPAHLDWDLWLGPAAERPYSPGIHPFDWRKFRDYGNGRLGDFGCHYLDLVHWALDLDYPESIEADGPAVDSVSTPEWLVVDYRYPKRDRKPPVHVRWHGGRKPKLLSELRDAEGSPIDWTSGQLFVGEQGMLLSNYSRHHLLPVEKFAEFKPPAPTIPDSIGHRAEWIHAIKNGGRASCHFDYAVPLTETVLLGVAAYQHGKKLRYDGANGRLIGESNPNEILHKEYRKGWTL